MSEEVRESNGRIEVAPEVLATIAYYAVLRVDGDVDAVAGRRDAQRCRNAGREFVRAHVLRSSRRALSRLRYSAA